MVQFMEAEKRAIATTCCVISASFIEEKAKELRDKQASAGSNEQAQ